MSDTFDRSQLDGKDREQLSEIASALGVKAISRMRKADLVDAIVAAAGQQRERHRPTQPALADPFHQARHRRPGRARRRAGGARPRRHGAAARTTWP